MKYKIVYRGMINQQLNTQLIKKNLNQLFRLPIATIEATFFSSEPTELVIKADLSEQAADQYRQLLNKAGIIVNKEFDMDLDLSVPPPVIQKYHQHQPKINDQQKPNQKKAL